MSERVTLPIGIIEVTMEYVRPNLGLWLDRIRIVDQLFDRYAPWDIKVDDVEVITEGKPSEQGIKFKLPKRRISFFFGPSQCRFTQDDADWDSALETLKILDISLSTLAETAGITIATYKTSIVIHIQPTVARFIDLLLPFASSRLVELEGAPLKAFATVLKWDKRRITLDGSAQLANGIFLRLERDFAGETPLPEIAAQLRVDEEEVLGVEESR